MAHRRKRRRNGGGGLAYLVNPGGMFGKKKRRRKRRKNMAKRRHHSKRRRRRNPLGFLSALSNPHRKHRRRRKARRHNPKRRHHARRRRNPSFGGIVASVKRNAMSKTTIGGAMGGIFDLLIGDSLMAQLLPASMAPYKGLAKVGVGLAGAAVMDMVGALSPYAAGFAAYEVGAGIKQQVGRWIGSPSAQLSDLADEYGALVQSGQAAPLGALVSPQGMGNFSGIDYRVPVGTGDVFD